MFDATRSVEVGSGILFSSYLVNEGKLDCREGSGGSTDLLVPTWMIYIIVWEREVVIVSDLHTPSSVE